ncbi:hypothetical protein ABK040_000639 [Willaertia magna]
MSELNSAETDNTPKARKLEKENEEEYLKFLEKNLEEEKSFISEEDIANAERVYNSSIDDKQRTRASFSLAVFYVKSGKPELLEKGIHLLTSLLRGKESDSAFSEDTESDNSTHYKRDCLYLIALAYYHLQDYKKAELWVDRLLEFDQQNEQGIKFKHLIQKKVREVKEEGILGLAMAGGGAMLLGGVLGLGALLAFGLAKSR